ncbi:alpha/beta fold hydrolase [Actinomadura opuntiae]|uniref:alpha/beta fold hydrolase n=1 Tax=Actinomadura sp. OS1-43 TaxID=604315 RepID=UPI00255A9D70|nr:alpha/beta hydrolase [Actinomadura sp. OS1-43]MDL4821051.1 alpha/beta hydrolase [Actinomadura sp. OS1-43]
MPFATANGIRLSYQRSGNGEPVLLIMGSGAAGRVWTLHQTPALNEAGYETIVFDNRGIAPSDRPPGRYTLAEMVADTRGLIEALELGPCRVVGTSMGAMIAQELAIEAPWLVRSAVLLAPRARADATRRAMWTAEHALREAGITPPPAYLAFRSALEMLSPATLNDDAAAAGWLQVFELSGAAEHVADGQRWVDMIEDRRDALRRVGVPCRAIGFADDLICPPHLVAEVAEAIPDCDYVQVSGCGHLGNLERPQAVNDAIIEFFDKN